MGEIGSSMIGGGIIFASIASEFYYLMSSIWRSQLYYMFGYLFINFGLLMVIIMLVSIISTYLQLNAQNHEWWWRSWYIGCAAAVYMFVFSVYYMIFELQMDMFAGEAIYLVYMMMFCTSFGTMCGSISTATSFLFVQSIYNNAKAD